MGRSILTGILSTRNTGSLAIWFRHQSERGAKALPFAPHSVTDVYHTTAFPKIQAEFASASHSFIDSTIFRYSLEFISIFTFPTRCNSFSLSNVCILTVHPDNSFEMIAIYHQLIRADTLSGSQNTCRHCFRPQKPYLPLSTDGIFYSAASARRNCR